MFHAEDLAKNSTIGNQLANFGATAAAMLANAATRSAIEGTSFGDNLLAGVPDVVAQLFSNFAIYWMHSPAKEVKTSPVAVTSTARVNESQTTQALRFQHRRDSSGPDFDALYERFVPAPIPRFTQRRRNCGHDNGRGHKRLCQPVEG